MNFIQVDASKEISNDYLLYAVSTANRAIPSATDGLKLVHRRIIQTCIDENFSGSWVKTAKISGAVMGSLHPHGCLHRKTKVRLLNGTSKYIEELYKIGKDQWILAYSQKNKRFEPKLATNFRVGAITNKAVKFIIDGRPVICTHDHRFLTTNRGWVRAEHLTTQDNILSCNISQEENGYTTIKYGSYFSKIESIEHITYSCNHTFYDFTVDGPENMMIELDDGRLICTHNSSGAVIQNMSDVSNYLNPLMAGHGNLGGFALDTRQKISSDGAASERYTESKMSAFGEAVFDIPIRYLPTKPNYDNSKFEVVNFVPALPLALINANQGIGTGYATSSVGFVASNVVSAINKVHDQRHAIAKLGIPDFAHNTNIIKNDKILELHETGCASIDTIGSWSIATNYDTKGKRNRFREAIIISKIASGDAEKVLNEIAKAVEQEKIEIANVIDETSNEIRIIVVCKAKQKAEHLLPGLLRYTGLASKQSARLVFIKDLLPTQLTPYELLKHWYDQRFTTLRTMYIDQSEQLKSKLHIKAGIYSLYNKLQEIALLIMKSDSVEQAKSAIMHTYKVDSAIAEAILAIQLKQLVRINKDRLSLEIDELKREIDFLNGLILDDSLLHKHIVMLAKKVLKHCTTRVSSVIEAPSFNVKQAKQEPATLAEANFSTRAFNKAKKLYFDSGPEYSYCNSIDDLKQALAEDRHPLDDVPKQVRLKKSTFKSPRKRGNAECPILDDKMVRRANNKGVLTSVRLKEHIKYWEKK